MKEKELKRNDEMVLGITEAVNCISGMRNVVINEMRKGKKPEDFLDDYVKEYERLILGDKKRDTKYWFVIIQGNVFSDSQIQMHFGERCFPKKYEIKDKKIWWFGGMGHGMHEDNLFETYDEARKHLIEQLEFEISETKKKVEHLNKKEYYHRKEEKSKTVSKCGCKH